MDELIEFIKAEQRYHRKEIGFPVKHQAVRDEYHRVRADKFEDTAQALRELQSLREENERLRETMRSALVTISHPAGMEKGELALIQERIAGDLGGPHD